MTVNTPEMPKYTAIRKDSLKPNRGGGNVTIEVLHGEKRTRGGRKYHVCFCPFKRFAVTVKPYSHWRFVASTVGERTRASGFHNGISVFQWHSWREHGRSIGGPRWRGWDRTGSTGKYRMRVIPYIMTSLPMYYTARCHDISQAATWKYTRNVRDNNASSVKRNVGDIGGVLTVCRL